MLATILLSASGAFAKTAMVLLDAWSPLQAGSRIANPTVGYYTSATKPDGTALPALVQSGAYTSRPFTSWYAFPDFSSADFGDKIALALKYQLLRPYRKFTSIGLNDSLVTFPDSQTVVTYRDPLTSKDTTVTLPQTSPRQMSIPAGATLYSTGFISQDNAEQVLLNRSTSGMHSKREFDRCFDSLQSDTIWIRILAQAGNLAPEGTYCHDHNPELPSRGRVRFYSPITGAKVEALVGDLAIPMRPTEMDGWREAKLFGLPGDAGPAKVGFRVTTKEGSSWVFDSAGVPYSVTDSVASPYIHPPLGGASGFRAETQPARQVVLAWSNPWTDRLPELTFGGMERIAGTPHPGGWRSATLWVRPASAWLVSLDGDEKTEPVNIPSSGASDTIWLTTRYETKAPGPITATGYDYMVKPGGSLVLDSNLYFPFSELTNSGLTIGLLSDRIGHGAKPTWTGRSICGPYGPYTTDTKEPCLSAENSPDKWFDSISISRSVKNLKVRFQGGFSPDPTRFYKMGGDNFFPFDTILGNGMFSNKLIGFDKEYHNFGFCFELHGSIQPGPGYLLESRADDDTWIYVDSQLVVDMGGQHSVSSDTIRGEWLRTPVPSLVPIDIYHCERHTDIATFSIRTNAPIYPAGAIRLPSGGTSSSRAPISGTRLLFRAGQILIQMPASQAWTLEMRRLDGRVLSRWTGTGARNIPVQGTGMRLLRLTAGSTSMQISTLVH